MKHVARGYRVAVVGASSLLGKELLTVLEERKFPVSRLITLGADEADPELPIVDLNGDLQAGDQAQVVLEQADEVAGETEVDFAFLAGRADPPPPFLSAPGGSARQVVIDLVEAPSGGAAEGEEVLSVPFLDREVFSNGGIRESKRFLSVHPAAIVMSSLLLRLAAHFPLRAAVAQVFGPASEIGSRAIEELQRQTINLLSFRKIPESVFGAQLAFNVLPRLGRTRRGESRFYRDGLTDLESRIRTQLKGYLANRVPLPALRVIQVPVFYSLTVSLYVETAQPADLKAVERALAGERIRVQRLSDRAPSQVDVAGTSDILVDAITVDSEHPDGVWLWATADNLRLSAVNAVEIAESLNARIQHQYQHPDKKAIQTD
jgi:aspartate-semialdehyde dehydrogenase